MQPKSNLKKTRRYPYKWAINIVEQLLESCPRASENCLAFLGWSKYNAAFCLANHHERWEKFKRLLKLTYSILGNKCILEENQDIYWHYKRRWMEIALERDLLNRHWVLTQFEYSPYYMEHGLIEAGRSGTPLRPASFGGSHERSIAGCLESGSIKAKRAGSRLDALDGGES